MTEINRKEARRTESEMREMECIMPESENQGKETHRQEKEKRRPEKDLREKEARRLEKKALREEKKARENEEARKMHEQQREARMRAGKPGGGGHGPGMKGAPADKAKDFRGTLKKLIKYMNRHKAGVIMVWVFAIASTIFNIIGPKVLGQATTELFNGLMDKIKGTGGIDFTIIGKILLIALAIYVFSALCNWVQGWKMARISQDVAFDMREGISRKIHRLPMKYFESRTTGDILSRITNDVDTLAMALNQSITQLITSITTIVGVVIMMLTISPLMTLITLCILPVSIGLMGLIIKKSQKHFINQQKFLGKVNGQVEEVYSGQVIVKAYNREAKVVEEFDKDNDKLYESAFKSQFLSGLMMPITIFVGNLGYVAVVVAGAILAANGRISVGDIQAFIQYVRTFTQPIQQFAQVSNQLQSMVAAAERIFEFLEEEEERQEGVCAGADAEAEEAGFGGAEAGFGDAEAGLGDAGFGDAEVGFGDAEVGAIKRESAAKTSTTLAIEEEKNSVDGAAAIRGQVDFEHVKFGYDKDKIIINDWSAHVKPGQTVAIVGPTGAGKTTIVKLLMHFYDLDGGKILLDGRNINAYDRRDLHECFGMVLQDTWLFKGSIMENIRYGKLAATDEEVRAAARAALADRFIRTLPNGYETELSEDAGNVSQGQKQLITIARAILADKPVLILDEATSSVDTRTEQLIQNAMDNLMKGRTSFVIAHRLSTIRDADIILVMKDGDIIESGTHSELLAEQGFYADLYNAQFEKE